MSNVTIKKIVKVHLERSANSSWGFQLIGGTEFGEALKIGQITAGTMADQAGLRMGDQILEIKGVIVEGKSHQLAKDLIVKSGNIIDIVIDRSADAMPTSMTNLTMNDTQIPVNHTPISMASAPALQAPLPEPFFTQTAPLPQSPITHVPFAQPPPPEPSFIAPFAPAPEPSTYIKESSKKTTSSHYEHSHTPISMAPAPPLQVPLPKSQPFYNQTAPLPQPPITHVPFAPPPPPEPYFIAPFAPAPEPSTFMKESSKKITSSHYEQTGGSQPPPLQMGQNIDEMLKGNKMFGNLQSPDSELFTPKGWSAFKSAPLTGSKMMESSQYNSSYKHTEQKSSDGQNTSSTSSSTNYISSNDPPQQLTTPSALFSAQTFTPSAPTAAPAVRPRIIPVNVEVTHGGANEGGFSPRSAPPVPPKPMSPTPHPVNPPMTPKYAHTDNAPQVLPRYPKKPQLGAMDYLKEQGGLFGTDPNFLAKLDAPPGYLNSATLDLIRQDDQRRAIQPPQGEMGGDNRPPGFYSKAQSYSFKKLEESMSTTNNQGPSV